MSNDLVIESADIFPGVFFYDMESSELQIYNAKATKK